MYIARRRKHIVCLLCKYRELYMQSWLTVNRPNVKLFWIVLNHWNLKSMIKTVAFSAWRGFHTIEEKMWRETRVEAEVDFYVTLLKVRMADTHTWLIMIMLSFGKFVAVETLTVGLGLSVFKSSANKVLQPVVSREQETLNCNDTERLFMISTRQIQQYAYFE